MSFPTSRDTFTRPTPGAPRSVAPTETNSFDVLMDATEAIEGMLVGPTHYNVKDPTYGAVGDGVTNDTAAIQSAINAAAAAGGGTVFVPPGSYAGVGVALAADVTLELDGVATTAFPAITMADGCCVIQRSSGATYVTSRGQFGFQFNNTLAGANNVAIYRQAQGAPALYLEDTDTNKSTAAAQVDAALRIERRNTGPSAGQARGIDIEDYFSGDSNVGPSLRINANKAGSNPAALVQNTHQAVPNAAFVGHLVIDNQQSGSTGNAGYEVRQYQDNIDGVLLRDGQRSNARVAFITKGSSGGIVGVNSTAGVERARLDGTGVVQAGVPGSTGGAVSLVYQAGGSGYMAIFNNSGNRVGYIGDATTNLQITVEVGNVQIQGGKLFLSQPTLFTQTVCGLWAGTGAPSSANGAAGDYYFRSDAGAGTHIYFREASSWAAVV